MIASQGAPPPCLAQDRGLQPAWGARGGAAGPPAAVGTKHLRPSGAPSTRAAASMRRSALGTLPDGQRAIARRPGRLPVAAAAARGAASGCVPGTAAHWQGSPAPACSSAVLSVTREARAAVHPVPTHQWPACMSLRCTAVLRSHTDDARPPPTSSLAPLLCPAHSRVLRTLVRPLQGAGA